jgi:hypothetical protein
MNTTTIPTIARKYIHPTKGRVIRVAQLLVIDDWATFTVTKNGNYRRFLEKDLPCRTTRAEAQADLDAYAVKNRFPEVRGA